MSTVPQSAGNSAEQARQAAECFDLKAKGHTVREIAARTGLSKSTVQRRITEAVDEIVSPRVEDYRALQDQQLDALESYLWPILEDPTEEVDTKLKVQDRLLKLLDRRSRLHGMDAPTRIEGTLVHQTQQEAELEQMFAQLDAANEATRKEIEAAPGDPTR